MIHQIYGNATNGCPGMLNALLLVTQNVECDMLNPTRI